MGNDERKEATPEEVEACRQRRLQSRSDLSRDTLEELKQRHFMHCPKCGNDLDEIVFRAVRVDKCFNCGGVYLDDGELEQLTGKPGWFEAMRSFFSR